MLKRLLKRPALWSLLVLAGCAVWQLRPLDRSALFAVQFANGKHGYVNPDGRVVVPGVWDEAYSFAADGRALVLHDQEYGFIDRDGKLLAPLGSEVKVVYRRRIGRFVHWAEKQGEISNSSQLVCHRDGKTPLWKQKPQYWGLRQNGKVIVTPAWEQIHPFDAADLAAVQKAGKWGFINRAQNIVIPLEWDHARPFAKNGLAAVVKDGRSGFINRKGKIAIALEWEDASSFHDNGLACVKKDGRYGFIDQAGKFVIPAVYDHAADFDYRNMAQVGIGARQGFIDPTGATVIPLEWEGIGDLDDGDSFRLHDIERFDGDGQVESLYREMESPGPDRAGLAIVRRNGKYGALNRRGEVIVNPEWDRSFRFDDHGLARVAQNNKRGLVNRKGEFVIPPEWDAILQFDDKQMAAAKKGEK